MWRWCGRTTATGFPLLQLWFVVVVMCVRCASWIGCGRFPRSRCCFGAKALIVIVLRTGRIVLMWQITGLILVPIVCRLFGIIIDGLPIEWKHCVVETFRRFAMSIVRTTITIASMFTGLLVAAAATAFPIVFVSFLPCRLFARIFRIFLTATRVIVIVLLTILFGFGRWFIAFDGTATAAITNTTPMSIVVHTIAIHCYDVIAGSTTATRPIFLERKLLVALCHRSNASRWFRSIEWKMDFRNNRCRMRCTTWMIPFLTFIQIDVVHRMMLLLGHNTM